MSRDEMWGMKDIVERRAAGVKIWWRGRDVLRLQRGTKGQDIQILENYF